MDWLLKGGLYIDLNKFYGYADIHDYVVGNFRNGCLRSYKVQKREGPLEGDSIFTTGFSIFTTGFIDYYSCKQIIKEYAPDTHLYNVSADVTLTIGGIYFVIVFIVGYINKKRS